MSELCILPFVKCQHCQNEWQYDDYCDLHSGSGITCPKCEQESAVLSVDTTMYARLGKGPMTTNHAPTVAQDGNCDG